MKILSIPLLLHDSSISIIENGKIIYYRMEERFSRKKHDLSYEKILDKLIEEKNTNFNKIFIEKYYLNDYVYREELLFKKLKKFTYDELIINGIGHHFLHAHSGFFNSPFNESICISLDGGGSVLDYGKNTKIIETESIFYLNKINIKSSKILYKKYRIFSDEKETYFLSSYYNNIEYYEKINEKEEIKNIPSVGEKFMLYGNNECNLSGNSSGKVMGLAQYKNHKEKLQYPYNTKEWKERVNGAYEVQQETQNHVLSLIQKYTEETGVKNVVISGGYGLNCVANYHYLKNLKDINLYIDPICFDAGISVGDAYYYYIQETQNNPPIQPLQNAYIGYKEETYDLSNLETQKVSYEDVVNLLLQKNIVALFQGRSEAGQRALGNRSLLFDPRISNGKDLVNQIKKRENFRPFAGTILLEESHKWFKMFALKESPYMQYAMDAYENAIEQVPAIIHADNTCRIQTVTQDQNEHFYNLINCFFEKTGVPMLLNTSFNLGGEPLVETFNHAVYTLKNSMIEYLYLPEIETLVTINNKKLMYQ